MNTSAVLFLVVVLAGIACVVFRAVSRASFCRGRDCIELAEMHADVSDVVSYDSFRETWEVLGESLGFDARMIRPSDRLEVLGQVDSWSLGSGNEKIEKWLEEKHVPDTVSAETVLELAILIEKHSTNASMN